MPPSLSQRMAGLPRWAWIAILSTGLIVGLYLRHRQKVAAATAGAGTDTSATDPSLASSVYGSSDPSLVGAAAGPLGGSVVPVDSPTIPQGIPEIIDTLGGTITGLGQGIVDRQIANNPVAVDNSTAPAQTVTAPTGGGPPPATPVKTPTGSGVPKLTPGFVRGLPGGGWPLAGFIHDHNLAEHKDSGAGKTGNGDYKILDIGAWNGSSWQMGRWHYYTSGNWRGQWHPA